MPSTSAKQARTMAAAAHNPAFARKVGIPVKVAKDFNRADMQKRQAAILRKPHKKPQMETEAEERAEPPIEEVGESPEFERREHGGKAPKSFKRTGSMASAGASVGGGA